MHSRRSIKLKLLYAGCILGVVLAAGLLVCAIHFHALEAGLITAVRKSPSGSHAFILDAMWSADSVVFTVDNGSIVKRIPVARAHCMMDSTMYEGTLRWQFAAQPNWFRELWPKRVDVLVWYNPKSVVVSDADVDGVADRIPAALVTTIYAVEPTHAAADQHRIIVPYKRPPGAPVYNER